MRIGELAGLVGVTTRTVRHYHRVGLLPEPTRRANGYRDYGLRDAVALVRVRRLTELGLSLEEVRDVLADDAARDLEEVLTELDADLARQEEAIRGQRDRLAELLRQARQGAGLPAEGPVSAELAALFRDMARTSAQLSGPEPAMAAKERQLLALLDGTASPEGRHWTGVISRSLSSDPAAVERAYALYALLDELGEPGVPADDPRVAAVARDIAGAVPEAVARAVAGWFPGEGEETADGAAPGEPAGAPAPGDGFTEALFADFAPAQAAAVREAIRLLAGRVR